MAVRKTHKETRRKKDEIANYPNRIKELESFKIIVVLFLKECLNPKSEDTIAEKIADVKRIIQIAEELN